MSKNYKYNISEIRKADEQGRWQGGSGGTFDTGSGIFRGPGLLRMPRVKIGIQVWKGNSGLEEGRQNHLDDDAKIINYNFCNF